MSMKVAGLMLLLLVLGCQAPPDLPEPTLQTSAPEVYGGGGIRPDRGISAVTWGPGGTVVVAPADPAGVLAKGDGALGFASFGNFALLDRATGREVGSFAAPCFWATPLVASPGFPLVAVRCGSKVHAIDPQTGHDTTVATESDDVRIAEKLAVLHGRHLEVFGAALAREATYDLPFAPRWWNAAGTMIAAVGEVPAGTQKAPIAWRSPSGVGSTALERVTHVDAFAVDGRRFVALSGSVLHWFDTRTRRWIGETTGVSVAAPASTIEMSGGPHFGFVGTDLWFSTIEGWRRFSGPDTELPPVAATFRGAVAAFSSEGVIVAAPTALQALAPDGEPFGAVPPWLSLRGVGLSRDGKVLVVVTDNGVALVDRAPARMTVWRDGASQAWLSGDGRWLAETDDTLGRVWLRDVTSGKTSEMTGIPVPNTEGALEGPGWVMHGQWTSDGAFVGIWRGWARGWIRSWQPGRPEPKITRELGGLTVGHDLQDEIWLLSADGARFMTPAWGGLRVETVDPAAAPKTLALPDGILDAAVDRDGGVVGLACEVHYPDATSGRTYRCQRVTAPAGSVAEFPPAPEVRLSTDGSLVFAADGETAVNVFSATGALVRRVELVQPGQWPDHSPWADGAVADHAMVIPLRDGRVQVIDGNR